MGALFHSGRRPDEDAVDLPQDEHVMDALKRKDWSKAADLNDLIEIVGIAMFGPRHLTELEMVQAERAVIAVLNYQNATR